MEKYYKKIKKRMIYEIILTIALIPVAIFTVILFFKIDGPIHGNTVLDFLGGFINGIRGGIVTAFVIYLFSLFVRDMKSIKDEKKLKELFITEHDERRINIHEMASRTSFIIILYIVILAALVCGLFNTTISLTLFCVWLFIVITRMIATLIYSKKF